MCTMTWLRGDGGYHVFFNRDERRTRKPAAAPAVLQAGGRSFIAPRDGDFGGTWLAVNDLGVTLALLNAYTADDRGGPGRDSEYTSRGLLVVALADAAGAGEVRRRLAAMALKPYRGFLLTVLDPDGAAGLARWTGDTLRFEDGTALAPPLVSSSFDTDEIRSRRVELFRRVMLEGSAPALERHLRYHESHRPARGAYSPCMHRPDAATVSFSWIRVTPDRVEFLYAPHSPCRGRPGGEPLCLARAALRPSDRPHRAGTSGR